MEREDAHEIDMAFVEDDATARVEKPKRHYTIKVVTRRYNKIYTILSDYIGDLVADIDVREVAARTCVTLGARKGPQRLPLGEDILAGRVPDRVRTLDYATIEDVLVESFDFVRNSRFTNEQARSYAWRVAGNTHKLLQGRPVPTWSAESQRDEWALFRVVDSLPRITRDGDHGMMLEMFFYTGAPAGLTFSRIYGDSRAVWIAHALGFSWKDAKKIYPRELTNMCGYILIRSGIGWTRTGTPIFSTPYASNSHKRTNKKLFNERLDEKLCPFHYKPETFHNCIECPLGYEKTDRSYGMSCRMAVRRNFDGQHDEDTSDEVAGRDEVVRARS